MRRLTGLDAQFLAGERGAATSHAIGLILYETGDPRLDAGTVKRLLSRRIHEPTPLRWRLESVPLSLDHPVFVDTDVDLDEHVDELTLPEPADERALGRLVGELLATPLDRTRPLWRIAVIHGLEGRVALAFAIHHAAADAFAMRQMFGILIDDLGAPPPGGDGDSGQAGRAPHRGE
ncbi:MAG: wax ester/triacylglycerol synthase domain-containing protein, partial [Candidatus Dormibacteria bacterium]